MLPLHRIKSLENPFNLELATFKEYVTVISVDQLSLYFRFTYYLIHVFKSLRYSFNSFKHLQNKSVKMAGFERKVKKKMII